MWMGMLATKNKRLLRQQRFLTHQLNHGESIDSNIGVGASENVYFNNNSGESGGILKEIEGLDSLDNEEVAGAGLCS